MGDDEAAYQTLYGISKAEEYHGLFLMQEKQYGRALAEDGLSESNR